MNKKQEPDWTSQLVQVTLGSIKGKPVAPQVLELYEGDLAVDTAELKDPPRFAFRGTKIPLDVWTKVLAFLCWTQRKFKREAQLRLAYAPDDPTGDMTKGSWHILVLPQEASTGLATHELPHHADRAEAMAELPAHAFIMGTVHHHCDIGAFQSGTDATDELRQNGLHVTLGHMTAAKLDIDMRAIFRGIQYEVDPENWFDFPTVNLTKAPAADTEFPDPWRKRIIIPEPPRYVPTGGYYNPGYTWPGSTTQDIPILCYQCDGSKKRKYGVQPGDPEQPCPSCDGKGFITSMYPRKMTRRDRKLLKRLVKEHTAANKSKAVVITSGSSVNACPACDGVGYNHLYEPCMLCEGSGQILDQKPTAGTPPATDAAIQAANTAATATTTPAQLPAHVPAEVGVKSVNKAPYTAGEQATAEAIVDTLFELMEDRFALDIPGEVALSGLNSFSPGFVVREMDTLTTICASALDLIKTRLAPTLSMTDPTFPAEKAAVVACMLLAAVETITNRKVTPPSRLVAEKFRNRFTELVKEGLAEQAGASDDDVHASVNDRRIGY